ncbi:YggS family pyridoxal phosphate-dependent enzyme [Suttonella sp. R2A3]|uniref:YggS family pyridoxal phosphate-dependent enzyme n=1 Tax=Suttonella sp. R2A3 TaxID=2908648 RepID=UPI001F1DE9BD|nr:YggS family pyridoxal phosphate-dependent enzyme [Suttonella sp. R2A3]UJF25117.1 YggS family pyridoxal phosphate-dependent enzyme [Suttonella sp. R2A3]
MTNPIHNSIARVLEQISGACEQAERSPEDVRLMMVTKTVEAARIREALASGQTLIGENKVQEINAKYDALADVAHDTHLIGHLQTNKIKDVIAQVSCIQSLDRVKLAHKLEQRLEFEDRTIDVLVQVNTSGEASKFGVAPEDTLALIEETLHCERIRIRGLMTIGANTTDESRIRACFRSLREIQAQARDRFADRAQFDELSMGMSGDMALAIAEGSTLVRVGSAIFGAR